MEKRKPTAFISYSWDSDQHQLWVLNLMNKLRKEGGVEATMDIVETQSGTVNLNTMMVKALKDYDYVIMVLTEGYAWKADELKGGVGFETELSLPVLRNNPNKFILIARDEFGKAMPFHLQGYHAFDFTRNANFETSFRQLLHRIHNVPLYEVAPVGEIPDLQSIRTNTGNVPNVHSQDLHISELLSEIYSRQIPLSQCIAKALGIAIRVGDPELEFFCRHELTGWNKQAVSIMESKKKSLDFRLIELVVTPYQINLDVPWGSADELIDRVLELEHTFKQPTLIPYPISQIESDNEKMDTSRRIASIDLRFRNLDPTATEDFPLYGYARSNAYHDLLKSIRSELVLKLLDLLSQTN